MTIDAATYKANLVRQYWQYQHARFPEVERYFERPMAEDGRPPVFLREQAASNVIVNPEAGESEVENLLSLIPSWERHKWFRSMNSSQALAQSVFGNLALYDQFNWLADLEDDEGNLLFEGAVLSPASFRMEHKVQHLAEPRNTSLDGYFPGHYQVAIEFKFTETEVGACSRPRMLPGDTNYELEICDGSYTHQRGRSERCSLTQRGISYWRHIPKVFRWRGDADLVPCPVNKTYQLVRNVLAVSVQPNGDVEPDRGHVVLIYDDRNPAFRQGGDGFAAYQEVKSALLSPNVLRKCSWQRLLAEARERKLLPWLMDELSEKYAI